jgi:hypothetical protein
MRILDSSNEYIEFRSAPIIVEFSLNKLVAERLFLFVAEKGSIK